MFTSYLQSGFQMRNHMELLQMDPDILLDKKNAIGWLPQQDAWMIGFGKSSVFESHWEKRRGVMYPLQLSDDEVRELTILNQFFTSKGPIRFSCEVLANCRHYHDLNYRRTQISWNHETHAQNASKTPGFHRVEENMGEEKEQEGITMDGGVGLRCWNKELMWNEMQWNEMNIKEKNQSGMRIESMMFD
jgi:hypothetical protein